MVHSIQVRIATDDADHRAAWSEALKAAGLTVKEDPSDPAGLPLANYADVILTTAPAQNGDLTGCADSVIVEDSGIVAVQPATVGDVVLAADASQREVVLACRLVGEIVRLRRGQREGAERTARLRELAYTDALTGLANRRAWDDELPRRVERPPVCVAVFDADHFKAVNDAAGHAAGDRVLQLLGRALAESIRDDDLAARLGGDEFGLILADVPSHRGFEVVERIRLQVVDALSEDVEQRTPLTISAGFASSPTAIAGGESDGPAASATERLYVAADRALRMAKSLGRDRTIAASALDPPR